MKKKRDKPSPRRGKQWFLRQPVSSAPSAIDLLLRDAVTHHRAGCLVEAEALYRQILQTSPEHVDALHLLGVIASQVGKPGIALELIDKAIRVKPEFAGPHCSRGDALQALQQYQAAVESYDRAIALDSNNADALYRRGSALACLEQDEAALQSFDQALRLKPDYADAYWSRGNSLYTLRWYPAAVESYDRAIALNPNYAEAFHNRGSALNQLEQREAALESYDRALVLQPGYADAYSNRGNTLAGLQRYQEALESCDRAIALRPNFPEAHNIRGTALHGLKRFDEALASFDKAIELRPDYADAYRGRGDALQAIRFGDVNLADASGPGKEALLGPRPRQAALESYDRAIQLDPNHAAAHNNKGSVLHSLLRYQEALGCFDRAILLKPDLVEAHNNRGNTLMSLKQFPHALESFDKAVQLAPHLEQLPGNRLFVKRHLCDWEGIESECQELEAAVARGERAANPFATLVLSGSAWIQRKAAETHAPDQSLSGAATVPIPDRPKRDKIRIGYFSADYYNHATSYLMAEVFERHDRSRFEVFGFAFGPDKADEMSQRVSAAMDRFIDVRSLADREVAQLSRELEVDIAVDLKGITAEGRAGIFAERAAPIQVSYLGYPGTVGADSIDYLIADPTLIPEASQRFYSEKIVYLPDSYQANDSQRPLPENPCARADEGLPESGFVYCCFNSIYKICPPVFDIWMRILARVEGSVLWLLEDNPWAAANLRKEAERRGISPERLVFARPLPMIEHLSRHRLADLFLDTLPYNAHTTASDALWTGLPLLTRMGETFASRVAASLLRAVGMPELITETEAEYEQLAVQLAHDPERRRALCRRLQQNRPTAPLFDCRTFTRHLEAAYAAIYERHHAGLPPDHIHIAHVHIARGTS